MGIVVPEAWASPLAGICRGTILVVGDGGSGKSALAGYLVGRLQRDTLRVALLSTDPGQATIGPPGCLGMALTAPWRAPAALWFTGDFSPRGSLLPTVMGCARLVMRAREAGAETVVIDTMGWVHGAAARSLHYHLAQAAGADQVLALAREHELDPLLAVLEGGERTVIRLPCSPLARQRPAAQRHRYRQQRLRAHFATARTARLPRELLLASSWEPVPAGAAAPPPGTLLGLLEADGHCLALAVLEGLEEATLRIFTPCQELPRVARVLAGRELLGRDENGDLCQPWEPSRHSQRAGS